jgi:hypothetical protein
MPDSEQTCVASSTPVGLCLQPIHSSLLRWRAIATARSKTFEADPEILATRFAAGDSVDWCALRNGIGPSRSRCAAPEHDRLRGQAGRFQLDAASSFCHVTHQTPSSADNRQSISPAVRCPPVAPTLAKRCTQQSGRTIWQSIG